MSEINQVEVLIKPQVPKVIDNQQLFVYIPATLIVTVSNDFEIDYGQLKLKNPNVAYTDISNIFSKIQTFESNAMFNSGFSKVGGYDFTLPNKSGTIALLSDIASVSRLVDDVRVNGQSIVENKVANIVIDTQTNAQSSNPIANSLFTTQITALGTTINAHVNNKTNPHNVTAAQLGLGNVTTELATVERDLSAHEKNTDNPHKVTAAQIGLGNVDNTSDANKPVSTAQKAALDKKIDKTGGTFSGNVAIQGNLTVSGTTTTESAKQLAVKENVIVTNADKANLQTLLSGLAINKNSTATYGIMYDPADDTVKFGEGTLDANHKFVFKAGEGHPLAIRADSSQFTDAVLVKWNATTKAFEPASGTWQDLLNKIEITDIDLTFSDETVLYNTTNGIQLSATGKITRKDGTSEQPQVDLNIPIVSSNGIIIEKVANKEQIAAKIDTSVVALKSDLTLYAKTTDLAPYAKTVDVVEKSQVGAASGVASLGADGKVPAAQLPTIDNYSKFSEVKLQNSNIVPTYSATTGITVTSTGSMKHANNVVDTPKNTMVVPITAGKNMGATKSGNLVVFTANDQVGVGATLPAGSDSKKIFINTAENTAKIYYNDNGTWKVVNVPGGGGGSIDADTLNGLLSAGDGISIGKTTAGDKVEVKIDPAANIVGATFETRDNPTSPVEYTRLRYSGVFEYHNPMFDYTFSLPVTGDSGMYQLLASNYVKTLFGNQSIAGSGNIDLYQHNIVFTSTDQDKIVKIRFIVISSKNLVVDSLTDLKTLLGNTFTYPVNGANSTNNQSIYEITETGYKSGTLGYVLYDTVTPYPAGTWTDTVTTI